MIDFMLNVKVLYFARPKIVRYMNWFQAQGFGIFISTFN